MLCTLFSLIHENGQCSRSPLASSIRRTILSQILSPLEVLLHFWTLEALHQRQLHQLALAFHEQLEQRLDLLLIFETVAIQEQKFEDGVLLKEVLKVTQTIAGESTVGHAQIDEVGIVLQRIEQLSERVVRELVVVKDQLLELDHARVRLEGFGEVAQGQLAQAGAGEVQELQFIRVLALQILVEKGQPFILQRIAREVQSHWGLPGIQQVDHMDETGSV